MSEQHLEDLLKFSEDQLRQMDYSRIMHGERYEIDNKYF